jgi:iron complex outermembrane receptor protein
MSEKRMHVLGGTDMKSIKLGSVSCIAVALVVAFPAAAQQSTPSDTPEAEASSARTLDTVTVTALRREESLQDAAVAIEAYDQDQLTRTGLESAQDLGTLSPALGVVAGGGPLTSLYVRGVGARTVNPLTDAAVAQNIDGVYLGRASGAAGLALYDLERVELLKGPQGTLYGRNATGGVVNYIPQKPIIGELSGYAQAEIGNYSKLGLQGAINIPVSDKVAIRLSGSSLDRDGYSDDGTNDADSLSLRGQLLVEPTDRLSIRIAADYSENNALGSGGDLIGTFGNPPAGNLTEFTPSGVPMDSGPTAAAANAIRTGVLHTPSFAFYQPLDVNDLYQNNSFSGVMAEINYETDAGTLTVIPAYRESDQDYTFIGPGFAPAKTREQNSQTSLEARFATDLEGPLNGIVGAFYIEEDIQTSGVFAQNYASPIQNYDNGGDSWAIFGQTTFDVTDTFRLNAGVRYTEDSKFVDGISDTFITFCGGSPMSGEFLTPPASFANGCAGGIPPHPVISDRDAFIQYFVDAGLIAPGSVATVPGNGPPPVYNLTIPGGISPQIGAIVNVGEGALQSELEFGETTYRLGAELDWGDSNLLYAGFERGYRAGGVDLSIAAPTYDSEFIDAYTVGSKNRFLGNTLQVNAEAFIWKYDGQQVTYFTTLNGASSFPIANGDATITGLDVDMIWAATDATTLYGNVQFLDSTYDSLTLISDPGAGRFGCASEGVSGSLETYDCSGQSLLYSPEFGLDIGINHVLNIGSYELSLTADASHRGEQSTDFSFLDATKSDSYTTLNLDATVTPSDGRWSVSAYLRNATDERFFQSVNLNNRGLAYGIYNAPQTYGIRLKSSF